MGIPLKIDVTTSGLMVKQWNEIAKSAWLHVGEIWWRRMLPKHFQTGADQEYNYALRTVKYLKKKMGFREFRNYKELRRRNPGREIPLNDPSPLVYTGELADMVTQSAGISATSKGVTVALRGPKYFQPRALSGQPDLAREVTAVSKRDLQQLERYAEISMTRDIQKAQDRQ